MDENKLQVLQTIGYEVHPACGMCVHGNFGSTSWGTCSLYKYSHKKHTGDERQLSIHIHGVCKTGFRIDPTKAFTLERFQEFLRTAK